MVDVQALASGEAPRFVGFDERNSDIPEAVWLAHQFPGAPLSFRASDFVGQAGGKSRRGSRAAASLYCAADSVLHACPFSPIHPPRDVWPLKRRQDRNDPGIGLVVDYITHIFNEERDMFAAPASAGRKMDLRNDALPGDGQEGKAVPCWQ